MSNTNLYFLYIVAPSTTIQFWLIVQFTNWFQSIAYTDQINRTSSADASHETGDNMTPSLIHNSMLRSIDLVSICWRCWTYQVRHHMLLHITFGNSKMTSWNTNVFDPSSFIQRSQANPVFSVQISLRKDEKFRSKWKNKSKYWKNTLIFCGYLKGIDILYSHE